MTTEDIHPIALVHEDAHLLVLDKPAGLLCVPGRGEDKQDCLSARVQRRWPDALARREVHKRYEAIVDGVLPVAEEWAVIDAPLMADWPRRPLQKIDAAGK